MNYDVLKGKTAFITGATGGIGSAVARKLASLGCNLLLTSRNNEELNRLVKSLSKYDVEVYSFSANLKYIEEVYKVVEYSKNTCQRIDILINSAGVFPNASLFGTTDEMFSETFDVNFRSIFLFTREFADDMVSNKWGRIVNIGSSSSYFGFGETSVYCASKHSVLGFSKSIHDELKQYNVRTYCISPSSTKSKMGLKTKGQDYSTFLDPDDISEYVAFVISFNSNLISDEIFLKRMVTK